MKGKIIGVAIVFYLILGFSVSMRAEPNIPKNKQTVLGLYITARDAYFKWYGHKEKVVILDVRTLEEYIFVGHAPMARNIPVKFLNQKQTIEKMRPVMEINPDFVSIV